LYKSPEVFPAVPTLGAVSGRRRVASFEGATALVAERSLATLAWERARGGAAR